jgi:hypothetical protein
MQGILREIDIVKRTQSFRHLHGDIDLPVSITMKKSALRRDAWEQPDLSS